MHDLTPYEHVSHTCFLCGDHVAKGDFAEYDNDGEIVTIHLACGQADNADRAEAAYFASGAE